METLTPKVWIKISHVKSLVSTHSAYSCKNYILMHALLHELFSWAIYTKMLDEEWKLLGFLHNRF